MIKQEGRDLERKEVTILKILKDSPRPVGARVIAHRLREYGIDLTERAVRVHLHMMDERGLTHLAGTRLGRMVTKSGINEIDSALVGNRVGSAMTHVETLICQTSFEPENLSGDVPVNVSLFPLEKFGQALQVMKSFGNAQPYTSNLVFVAGKGEKLGGFRIPEGKVGFVTLSGITVGAFLFKAGIPLNFMFAGVLQIRNNKCYRFVDLIEYTGSSLNPYEVFISCKMTSVSGASREGNGNILASFCELPSIALPRAEAVIKRLDRMGIKSVAKLGRINEPLCEIPVGAEKFGIILTDGLNLVAAVIEAGIEVENHANCTLLEFTKMRVLNEIL
jgi:HTH-type transcriptional regulator, global nitrogen regulator NrpRI